MAAKHWPAPGHASKTSAQRRSSNATEKVALAITLPTNLASGSRLLKTINSLLNLNVTHLNLDDYLSASRGAPFA